MLCALYVWVRVEKMMCGGEGNTCMFLWQRGYQKVNNIPVFELELRCVRMMWEGRQSGGAFLPKEVNIPKPLIQSHC